MRRLRVHLARLVDRIATWSRWGECPLCGRHHDPGDHYGLHDDTYE